jgi:hypothetical protein
MMPKQIAFLLAVFVVLCALFVVGERTFSTSFQQCIAAAGENTTAFGVTVDSYVRCTGRFVKTYEAAITALATIIIAAFTGTLWVATSRQAELTREALIADKRAFVFATGFNGFWERSPTGQYNWRFRPVWQNSGDTPTKDMRMHTSCELRNTPLPRDFDFDRAATQTGTGLLPPRATNMGGLAPMPPMAAITPQNLLDVQQGRQFLYLWGWVRYFDVFPNTKQHITRFCWMIVPIGDPFTYVPDDPQHTLRFDHIHNTEGNCADDECR